MVAAMVTAGLWAQEKKVQDPARSKELNTEADGELLREDVQAKRQEVIKKGMQLDEKRAASFWRSPKNTPGNQSSWATRSWPSFQDYAKNFMTMDDAKADELAQRVMALDEQRTALRKKYYQAMKKVLPTVLVLRFFRLENQVQMLIDDLQIASDLSIMEEAPALKVNDARLRELQGVQEGIDG